MPSISENTRKSEEERRVDEGRPTRSSTPRDSIDEDKPDMRQPLGHRMLSQTVIGSFARPSLSINARHSHLKRASDPRGSKGGSVSKPTDDEVRRFYAAFKPADDCPPPTA